MKKVLVPLAPGFEEIEAVTVIDILRRAGVDVLAAGTIHGEIAGRTGIKIMPDAYLDDVIEKDYDMIVLPGGAAGAEHLKKDRRIRKLLEVMAGKGGFIAAICAAPAVLSAVGLLRGRHATSHPSVQAELREAVYQNDRVVVDGALITSRAPGTAMEFAMKLVEVLEGPAKVQEVNKGVLARI